MARPPTAVTRGALAALTAEIQALRTEIAQLKREAEARDRQQAEAAIVVMARCLESNTYSVQSLELLRAVIANQEKLPAQLINGVAVFLPPTPPSASPSTSS